ncbi:helix-turn-helix domain-containing protein [Prauserella endophytica]|nr:hypothetical protein [Prauserella endophytica]
MTARERGVLTLVATGPSNTELPVSLATVKTTSAGCSPRSPRATGRNR